MNMHISSKEMKQLLPFCHIFSLPLYIHTQTYSLFSSLNHLNVICGDDDTLSLNILACISQEEGHSFTQSIMISLS